MSGDELRHALDGLGELVAAESAAARRGLEAMARLVAALRESSHDPRLASLAGLAAELDGRLAGLAAGVADERLPGLRAAAAELRSAVTDGRLGRIVASLLDAASSREGFLVRLLDGALEATGAERGYVVLAHPASTEAEVAAARHYASTNLSLDEYRLSRSLVREALASGEPLLLADAAEAPTPSRGSVRRFGLRSVLVAPLVGRGVPLGAVYLEDATRPGRFGEDDRSLLAALCRVAVFFLGHAGLLPRPPAADERVFLDASRAAAEIVGRDPKIAEVLRLVRRVADAPATVLVVGESGTGKDLVARALHYESARRDGPFVAINCAAIPRDLVESELFGHEKGAFTGATERRAGRVEQADGGTLFLDEVDELAPELQAKLLRFLQSGEVGPLGGRGTRHVDVRIVAAASRDLRARVAEGRFLDALYYRLHVVPIELPPLRERRGDVALLARHFLAKYSALYRRSFELAPEVLAALERHDYPGNVRELENLVHRLVALAEGPTIRLGDLPAELAGGVAGPRWELAAGAAADPGPVADLDELARRRAEADAAFRRRERELAERVVAESGGNVSEAARRLGVHRVTLHRLLKRRG